MPRIRPARRSGWKTSSASVFSPVPMNLTGRPVTALIESAAPPRASPSIFVSTRPVSGTASSNACATLDRFLAGHRVDDQQRLDRLDRVGDGRDLGHQLLVEREATGRVEDDGVPRLPARGLEALAGDVDDGGALRRAVDGQVERLAERLELVGCGRAVRVRCDEDRPAAELDDVAGELGRGRRLARALEPDEDDDRRVALQVERPVARREELDELLVDDLHDLLTGRQALEDVGADRALADPGDEVPDDLEVDVGLEQRQPDLAHRGVDVRLADAAATGQGGERLAQAIAEGVEHQVGKTPSCWCADSGDTEADGV